MKLLARLLVVWMLESVALLTLVTFLPGIDLANPLVAAAAVLVIGLLNALVRPVVLLVSLGLGLIPLVAIALLLNAAVILVASWLVPDFTIANFGVALLVSIWLAALNGVITGALTIDDDDSFYRYVIRRIDRLRAPGGDLTRTGTIIVQIDGLAAPLMQREIEAGRMPTLARWIAAGSHRLVAWHCDVPSMTPGSQAGILHGSNANIPAFRWYEKESRRLIVSNHPVDARLLDRRLSTGNGLLHDNGSSIGNIFSGDAARLVVTQCGLVDDAGRLHVSRRDFYTFLLSPYSLSRAVVGMVWEVVIEYWEAWRQRRNGVQPRMHRGGAFPLLRAVSNVLLRDATLYLVVDDMYSGRLVSYSDFLGYDEIAHHAGPRSEDALRALRRFDRKIRWLEHAARTAPRPYQFVVLSDHGQSEGATFHQRYGYTLATLVQRLLDSGQTVGMAGGVGEGWSHLNAVLTEVVSADGVMARGARRAMGERAAEGYPAFGPDREQRATAGASNVVVCASGNLAHIYFAEQPGRLNLEFMLRAYPGLIEGLVAHEGIGFVLVHSEARGPLVIGRRGTRFLDTDAVEGDDPLAGFEEHTARHLRRLSTYPNVGDIVVNSLYDQATGQVAAFEELIGCHGGAGGLQTLPFILFPATWTDTDSDLVGAEAVHTFLRRHIHADNHRAAPSPY